MSSTITLSTGETATIHGSLEGAKSYLAMQFGDAYDAWRSLSGGTGPAADDPKKQTLATAVRYLNAQNWQRDYDTFEKRDTVPAFEQAEYELAALIASDASFLNETDQGSNIQSLGAGSASISFFNPTTKNAAKLPPTIMRLVGQYLAGAGSGVATGPSQSGSSVNPFSKCEDYDRGEPW